MVYGQTLRIPGELVVASVNSEDYNSNYILQKLKKHFSNTRNYISHNDNNRSYIPPTLMNCKYVFLKINQKFGLNTPFEGPFKVIERNNKCFKIQKNDSVISVHIDQLKPAFTDDERNRDEDTNLAISPKKKVTFNLNNLS